jgi:hypothetical protein
VITISKPNLNRALVGSDHSGVFRFNVIFAYFNIILLLLCLVYYLQLIVYRVLLDQLQVSMAYN